MYITCRNCNTSFVVTLKQIGQNGRTVKCSKCSNIWHQKLNNKDINQNPQYNKPSEFNSEFNYAKSSKNLPAPIIYTQKTHNSFTFLLVSIIILLSFLLIDIL